MVQPGDIIYVKTPNIFYDAMRKLYSTEHDHMIVVVDAERCLHITYPKAKLMPVQPFLHIKRDPLLVRVSEKGLSQENRRKFISELKHASVGVGYDSRKLMKFLRLSVFQRLGV